MAKHTVRQHGFALIGVMLFLLLLSAMAVTLTYTVTTEKRMSGSDQEQNQAYYSAEAGMEKMTADLGALYTSNRSPSAQQIINLGNDKPNLPGVGYLYSLSVPQNPDGSPQSRVQTISAGDMAGLSAQVIPISLDVTATRVSGAQVHLTRDVEVAEIPVFQFGVFSDTDLSYHAGPNFDFAGRVHTNGDLYLSQSSGAILGFHDKITVGGEIIRQTLVNGVSTTPSYTGTVYVPTAPSGCTPTPTVLSGPPIPGCRALALIEGSVVGGKGSGLTPGWDSLAANTYNHMINHQSSKLTLPFVQDGPPIEIIREPLPTDTTNLNSSRLFTQAQIRVLLADTQADLPTSANSGGDVNLDTPGACFPITGANTTCVATANDSISPINHQWKRPPGTTGDWSLINGWLRVEARQNDGSYKNVTQEWLKLGFARDVWTPDLEHGRSNTVNPNAILIFQQLADLNKPGTADNSNPNQHYNWLPLNFYDAREGERRENAASGTSCSVGGIMNAVELDVGNLRKWLLGTIVGTGVNTESASQNGYILYYGDHRGMLADPSTPGSALGKHGDFGYEDFINSSSPSGASDNFGEPAEDVNEDGALQTYGASNLGSGFGVADNDPTISIDCSTVGRLNRVSGARHALIAVNGSLGQLPINFANNTGGFTIASEEPVYVEGNYNASDAGQFGDPHASAAVIADAVTLLSKNWNNEVSMFSPRSAKGKASCSGPLANPVANNTGRQACTTWYRLAIASGKSIPFPHPSWSTSNDFGTDGGVHNFLRYLEQWDGQTSHYEGSMVSLYFSRYGVGVFKCCDMVYRPPDRKYAFDADFLDPSKMPPGTPRFIDVVNVDVVQDMKPR